MIYELYSRCQEVKAGEFSTRIYGSYYLYLLSWNIFAFRNIDK